MEYLKPSASTSSSRSGRRGQGRQDEPDRVLGVFRKGEPHCLARGEIVWVCSRPGSGRSHALPEDLAGLIAGYEKGGVSREPVT